MEIFGAFVALLTIIVAIYAVNPGGNVRSGAYHFWKWLTGSDNGEPPAKVEAEPVRAAQSGRIVVAIIRHHGKTLLVKRRPNPEGLNWMFPSGFLKRGDDPPRRAESEVMKETNVTCKGGAIIGERRHPKTDALLLYIACEYLDGEARNNDPEENEQVLWVEDVRVKDYIGSDLFDPIAALLNGSDQVQGLS